MKGAIKQRDFSESDYFLYTFTFLNLFIAQICASKFMVLKDKLHLRLKFSLVISSAISYSIKNYII